MLFYLGKDNEEEERGLEIDNVLKRVQSRGYSEEALNVVLQQYSRLDTIMVKNNKVYLVDRNV